MYECTETLCQRSSSEAIPIPLYMERRQKHAECQNHHEKNDINQQLDNVTALGKLDSSETLNFAAESSSKTTPDEQDDSLLLYVSFGDMFKST